MCYRVVVMDEKARNCEIQFASQSDRDYVGRPRAHIGDFEGVHIDREEGSCPWIETRYMGNVRVPRKPLVEITINTSLIDCLLW